MICYRCQQRIHSGKIEKIIEKRRYHVILQTLLRGGKIWVGLESK